MISPTYVCKHIKHADYSESCRRGHLECSDRIFGFGKCIIGIAIADITPDDVVQSCDNSVGATSRSLKSIGKIVWLLDSEMATKRNKARDDDQEKN